MIRGKYLNYKLIDVNLLLDFNLKTAKYNNYEFPSIFEVNCRRQ